MGAQATSVCIEMPASMDLGSADTGVKVKWNRSRARRTEEKIAGIVYECSQSGQLNMADVLLP